MNDLTGLVVSYNTKELLQTAIESLRKFYPDLPILIVDSSERDNDCYRYVLELSESNLNIERFYISGNIGHGNGMNHGIRAIVTKHILLFDSDIEMIKPCLKRMRASLWFDHYGIGQVITVDENGTNCETGIPYLHPHFCIINRARYFDYAPFVHHGAPLIKTMIEIDQRGAPPNITPLPTGGLTWISSLEEIHEEGDLNQICRTVEEIEKPNTTLLDLGLSGILYPDDRELLQRIEEIVASRFLFSRIDHDSLLPNPTDDRWLESIPGGVLKEVAQHLQNLSNPAYQGPRADHASPAVAASAITQFYRMLHEVKP